MGVWILVAIVVLMIAGTLWQRTQRSNLQARVRQIEKHPVADADGLKIGPDADDDPFAGRLDDPNPYMHDAALDARFLR